MGCAQRSWNGLIWLPLGVVAGIAVALFVPNTPMHASATDKVESFGIATGAVSDNAEAIYFLDYLTGDLNAIVIGRHPRTQAFLVTGRYFVNVLQDFKLDAAKNPKFLMATGVADLTRGGRGSVIAPSRAVLWVAEVASGRANAYAVPFNSTAHDQGQFVYGKLVPIFPTAFPFRKAAVPAGKATDDTEK